MKKIMLLAISLNIFFIVQASANIPANHWANNAIQQLASKGIIKDTLNNFRGSENTTRYEFAAMLARVLDNIDLEHADEKDTAAIKKLVAEFQNELEVLGARIKKFTDKKNNLDGWKIHGQMRFDITGRKADKDGDPNGDFSFDRARLFFQRDFLNGIKFTAMLNNDGENLTFERFYASIPIFSDTNLIAGRFKWDFEEAYHIGEYYLHEIGGFSGLKGILTDRIINGIGIERNFTNSFLRAYVTRTDFIYSDWELAAMFRLDFNERITFHLGSQIFLGEDTTEITFGSSSIRGKKFNNLWTAFAGLKFNFGNDIYLSGIYYYQKLDWRNIIPVKLNSTQSLWSWAPLDDDDFVHWALILEIPQKILHVADLWLEYGHFDMGFMIPNQVNGGGAVFANSSAMPSNMEWPLDYLRVALSGEFRKNFGWHIFYYFYNFDADGFNKTYEAGLGLMYRLNDSVAFGINYIHADNGIIDSGKKDDVIRFRTDVTF